MNEQIVRFFSKSSAAARVHTPLVVFFFFTKKTEVGQSGIAWGYRLKTCARSLASASALIRKLGLTQPYLVLFYLRGSYPLESNFYATFFKEASNEVKLCNQTGKFWFVLICTNHFLSISFPRIRFLTKSINDKSTFT